MKPDPFGATDTEQPPATPLAANSEQISFIRSGPDQNWSDIEKRMIMEALVKAGGRKNKAAVRLGWARSTLWRKMNQYGIR
jgi:DNA-binding NtrC family response regulator